MVRRFAALLAALALASPAAAQEAPRPLRLDLAPTLAVTGGAAGAALLADLLHGPLAPSGCRICETNDLDRWARGQLRWSDTASARRVSDVLLVATPALAVGGLALSGWRAGGGRRAILEDALVTAEAVSVAVLATQVAKYAFGRRRPDAWADPGAAGGRDANLSFWSGHTAATFAAATAAGTVARLRGYPAWPWILGLGVASAAACGWLRIAADRHWATDVLVGAAVGSLAGLGMPAWLHGTQDGPGQSLRVTGIPLGIAGTF